MGYIVFALTALVLPLPSGATVPRWALLSMICAVLLFRIELSVWTLAFCLYLALMSWVAPVGYEAGLLLWHAFLLVVIFSYVRQREINFRAVAIGAGLAIAVNSAVAIMQLYGWSGLPQTAIPGGLFYNRNVAAETAAMGLVFVVGYRLWWLVPGILPTLYFGSRTPVLALGVVGFLALWRWSRIAAVVLPIAAATFVLFGGSAIVHLHDLDQRFGVWLDTLPALNLWGHGLGSFIIDYQRLQAHTLNLSLRFENPHNDLLQIAYELGAIGVLLVGWLWLRMWKAERSVQWYALAVFLMEGCFGFPLYEPATAVLAACCAGYLFGLRYPARASVAFERRRIRGGAEKRRLAASFGRVMAVSLDPIPPQRACLLGHPARRPRGYCADRAGDPL